MNKFIPAIILFGIGGIIVILGGILGWVVLPDIIDDKIIEQTQLGNYDTLEAWSNSSTPIKIAFYIWHVTNPKDFLNGANAIPIVEEKGPYVYDEKRKKSDFNYDMINGKTHISYNDITYYTFNKELSGDLSEDDLVNVVDIAYAALVHGLSYMIGENATMFANAVNHNLNGTIVRENVRVSDLLFSGYNVSHYLDDLWEHLESPDFSIPEFEGRKFAVLRFLNATSQKFEIDTGIEDHKTFGQIHAWKGENKLDYWNNDDYCNMINGTDGSVFSPFVTKDSFKVFSSDLCRSIEFNYDSEMEYKDIPGYHFIISQSNIDSAKNNPNNKCFCTRDSDDVEECPSSGFFMIRTCQSYAPVTISLPHFLHADTEYTKYFNMTPKSEDHTTFIDIEKNSGIMLQASKRVQINVDMYPAIPHPPFNNRTPFMFPLFWFREDVGLSDKSAKDIRNDLLKPIRAVEISRWTLIGVGAAVLIGAIGYGFFKIFQ